MQKETLSRRSFVKWMCVTSSLMILPGCGGGGSGSPSVDDRFTGTYTGTYLFPASGEFEEDRGSFVLRVRSDGNATGVFNEGIVDRDVTTRGSVNRDGRISLSATFDNFSGGRATINVTGQISQNSNGAVAAGQLRLVDNDGSQNGNFTTTRSTTATSAQASQQRNSSLTAPRKRIGVK